MSQLHQVSELDQHHCCYSLEIYISYFLLLPFLWNPQPSKLANLQTEDLEGPGFNRRNKLYYGGSTLNVHCTLVHCTLVHCTLVHCTLVQCIILKDPVKSIFFLALFKTFLQQLFWSLIHGEITLQKKYLIRKVHCSTAAGYQCLKRKMLVDFQSRNTNTISLQYQYNTNIIPYNI